MRALRDAKRFLEVYRTLGSVWSLGVCGTLAARGGHRALPALEFVVSLSLFDTAVACVDWGER
jgi:hypothetical protein